MIYNTWKTIPNLHNIIDYHALDSLASFHAIRTDSQVVSRKDQAKYWCQTEQAYNYISVETLSMRFKESYLGKEVNEIISKPFTRLQSHENAISFHVYSLSKWALFRACMSREVLLMKRNSFIYIFKLVQVQNYKSLLSWLI